MHTTSRAVSVLDRNYKVGIRTCLLELLAALLFERYAGPPPKGRLLDLPVTLQSKRNSGRLVREVGRYVAGEGCAGESDWLGFTQTDSTHHSHIRPGPWPPAAHGIQYMPYGIHIWHLLSCSHYRRVDLDIKWTVDEILVRRKSTFRTTNMLRSASI